MFSLKNIFIRHISIMIVMAALNINAQKLTEDWIPVAHNDQLVYIDGSNLGSFKGDEIYIWVMEKYQAPIKIENIGKKIYRSNTYYLINKELKKYSIVEIIYYDKKDNVIKNFSYKNSKSDIADIKYSYPIIESSQMDFILQRCLMEIDKQNEKI